MASETKTYSLFDSLTAIPGEHYGATDLAKHLLRSAALDVTKASRNTQTSFRLVGRGRDITGGINNLIKKVETDTDWTNYDRYTALIVPLEDALFDLETLVANESSLHLPTTTSIDEFLRSVTTWKKNRTDLHALSAKLSAPEFDIAQSSFASDIKHAQKHDDLSFLQAILNLLSPFDPKGFNRTSRSHFNSVKNQLNALPAKLQDKQASDVDDVFVYAVQSVMVVYGITGVLQDSTVDLALKQHLRSSLVWSQVDVLVKEVSLQAGKVAPSVLELQKRWTNLVTLLKGKLAAQPTPRPHINLMKFAGRIARPYHAQSVALIAQCRFLSDQLAKLDEADHDDETIIKFNAALTDAESALKLAAEKVTQRDIADLAMTDVGKAFTNAKTAIAACAANFQPGAKWEPQSKLMENATEQDNARWARINGIAAKEPAATSTKPDIKVTIKMLRGQNSDLVEEIYTVKSGTRLGALLYNIAEKRSDTARILAGQIKVDERSSTTLLSTQTVDEIPFKSGARAIFLGLA